MKMMYLQIIILCGMLGVSIASETNVVYRTILPNGAKVDITEKVYKETRKPSKAQLAQTERRREQVRQRETHPESVCVYWESEWVVYKYEMRIVQDAKVFRTVWKKEFSQSVITSMISKHMTVFDVAVHDGKYSILYATNDGVVIDTERIVGGEYVSLKICAQTLFKNFQRGRIIWMTDLFVAVESEDMGKRHVELWRIDESSVALVGGCISGNPLALEKTSPSADESASKNDGAEQSVLNGTATNAISGQDEEVMLTERMKKNDFACGTNGVYSKSSITIKELKAVLGVTDLKEIKRAPSSSATNAVYIFKVKGAHCVIRTSTPAAVMSDDSTVVSVTVNTKTKNVKDYNHLTIKLTPAQRKKMQKQKEVEKHRPLRG